MGFYDRFILPGLLNMACSVPQIRSQRQLLLPQAHGRVLEVGFGTGLNIPWYNPESVELLWALEPVETLRKKAQAKVDSANLDCRWLGLEAEKIPLEDNSVDTVVLTYTSV